MDLLHNSTFVVGISFVAFIALIIYLKVPGKIAGLLDARAAKIREEVNGTHPTQGMISPAAANHSIDDGLPF